MTDTDTLRRMADRAADQHPAEFVAGALTAYQRRHGLSDEALAALLGCTVDALPRLALCRMPRPESYASDIVAIAAYAGCNPEALGAMLADGE